MPWERAAGFTLMDDVYMTRFFAGRPRCVEVVLRAVLFVCNRDALGRGLPLYRIERTVRETGVPFGAEEEAGVMGRAAEAILEIGREEGWEMGRDATVAKIARSGQLSYGQIADMLGIAVADVERCVSECAPEGEREPIGAQGPVAPLPCAVRVHPAHAAGFPSFCPPAFTRSACQGLSFTLRAIA